MRRTAGKVEVMMTVEGRRKVLRLFFFFCLIDLTTLFGTKRRFGVPPSPSHHAMWPLLNRCLGGRTCKGLPFFVFVFVVGVVCLSVLLSYLSIMWFSSFFFFSTFHRKKGAEDQCLSELQLSGLSAATLSAASRQAINVATTICWPVVSIRRHYWTQWTDVA